MSFQMRFNCENAHEFDRSDLPKRFVAQFSEPLFMTSEVQMIGNFYLKQISYLKDKKAKEAENCRICKNYLEALQLVFWARNMWGFIKFFEFLSFFNFRF